jgi:hypothetical protein
MQTANPVPRAKGNVVEVLDINGTVLGNAVWYGTPQMVIPLFSTGKMRTLSINGVDQTLPEDQQQDVTSGMMVTFDVTAPKPSAPAAGEEETDPPSA